MFKGVPGHAKLFEAAFPGDTDPIKMSNVVTAIAAFEATPITTNAPCGICLAGRRHEALLGKRGGNFEKGPAVIQLAGR